MKNAKKWFLASGLIGLLLTLSGCVDTYKSGSKIGQPTGNGWVYNLLVKPMGNAITYLVHNFDWSYGVAIIVLTIIVRIIIMPLGLYQSRKTMQQTERTTYLKPQIDVIQAKIKQAQTQEEKIAANGELQAFYKENNLSMFGGMGCLPLLIQMPIFTALFYAAKFTPGINGSMFLGFNLGKSSIVFVVLAGVSYLIQGLAGMIGVPEEQRKMMRSMVIFSPLMIVFISLSSPAGVTLYWIVGGIFSTLQTLITNLYHKPKIRAAIEEEFKKNPPKVVKPSVVNPIKPKQNPTTTNPSKRNSGKQPQRKKH